VGVKDLGVKDLGVKDLGVDDDDSAEGVIAFDVKDIGVHDAVGVNVLGVVDILGVKDLGVTDIETLSSLSSISTPSSTIVIVTLSCIPFNNICPLKWIMPRFLAHLRVPTRAS
jgi:hypothetical protein